MKLKKLDKEFVKPSKLALIRRRRTRLFDFALGFVGLCLAAVSSYLPYYVYFHESEFGPPTMQFTGRIDYGEPVIVERSTEIRRPLFKQLSESDVVFQNVDPVVTGSVQRDASGFPSLRPNARARPAPNQSENPSPTLTEHTSLVLVFATKGRALIRDGDDIMPVAVGSRLPDGSTVKSLSRSQNGWQVVTSNNHLIKLVY